MATREGGVGLKKLFILGLIGSACAANALLYSYDDGVSENALGLTAGGSITWANQFTAALGGETITNVQIAWGNSTASLEGVAVTARLWSDPNGDGNPADAVALSSQAGNIVGTGTNVFQIFDIADVTLLVGQNFFVGAEITHAAGQFPASFDTTAPIAGKSWISTGAAWTGSIFEITAIGFPGDWMIRADSTAVPEPATMAVLGLGAMALLRKRRR